MSFSSREENFEGLRSHSPERCCRCLKPGKRLFMGPGKPCALRSRICFPRRRPARGAGLSGVEKVSRRMKDSGRGWHPLTYGQLLSQSPRAMTVKSHLLVIAALAVSGSVSAQAYPAKPVTFIVPFSPGGGTDITARTVAAKLTEKWKQSVIVENRGGAGGMIGAVAATKAKTHVTKLLIGNVGTQSINPTLYPKLPYDPDKAFAPISLICELPFVLMASPKFAPNSVKELVALARANPEKVTYASSGQGGSPHLTAELFQLLTGTKLTHVPYKAGGPAMIDLMAGA